jgi:ATP-dependent RNA helicase DOB1
MRILEGCILGARALYWHIAEKPNFGQIQGTSGQFRAMATGEKRGAEESRESKAIAGSQQHNAVTTSKPSAYSHLAVGPEGCEANAKEPAMPAPNAMARRFEFELDGFQACCIGCIERGDSVLVAAHTSAGKTAIAQYAIAVSSRSRSKVLYTAPLKALSNQKYRQMKDELGDQDVGLMTGDVTIQPDSHVVVMTTEVLRSMLYNNSTTVSEAQWIVFDEIHYLRDPERGVVWEECVSLLPSSCGMVFLSATVPNASEFAQWVAVLHSKCIHVVHTDARPVPLQHYVFPAGGDSLHLAVSEDGSFQDANFQRAVSSVSATSETDAGTTSGIGGAKKKRKKADGSDKSNGGAHESESDISRLAKLIAERNADPAIFFSFSKKEVECNARKLASIQLTDSDEVKLIDAIVSSALETLSEHDKKLAQVANVYPLLANGIGVHHGGMLPVLKELVEVLFQENLVKLLCATETFSTGLNMPCRTAVFTSCRKFDGAAFRWVTGGEYTQMSGRAGRRGLDERGIVIMMLDARMDSNVARDVLLGQPDPITSSFSLTYPMLLNLMRLETVRPESLVQRSFKQFKSQRKVPYLREQAEELEHQRDSIEIDGESSVTEYCDLLSHAAEARNKLRSLVNAPANTLPFLQPGRLVRVLASVQNTDGSSSVAGESTVWGVIVNFERRAASSAEMSEQSRGDYTVDVLVRCTTSMKDAEEGKNQTKQSKNSAKVDAFNDEIVEGLVPLMNSKRGELVRLVQDNESTSKARVVGLSLEYSDRLSSVRIYLPQDLRQDDSCEKAMRMVSETRKRFKDNVPLLDPIEDMKVDSGAYKQCEEQREACEERLANHSINYDEERHAKLQLLRRKKELHSQAKATRQEIEIANGMVMQQELQNRKALLRRLQHVDDDGVVQRKGRAACELASADALVATELLMDGTFSSLEAPSICALVSCLVWGERRFDKSEQEKKLQEESKELHFNLHEVAKRVGNCAASCGLQIEPEEYASSFRPELMDCLRSWANGESFANCMQTTGVFEGSLVRAIRRVEEIIRQLELAAKALGDLQLAETLERTSSSLRREVPFAPSLFL